MALFSALVRRLRRLNFRLARSDLVTVMAATLGLVVVGTGANAFIEGWSWLDALYATIITITTVGYGDIAPQTAPGRVFAIIFTLFAIDIGGYAISPLAAQVLEQQATRRERQLRENRMHRIAEMEQHFVICGADKLGQGIAKKRDEEFISAPLPEQTIQADDVLILLGSAT